VKTCCSQERCLSAHKVMLHFMWTATKPQVDTLIMQLLGTCFWFELRD
jgi:hypothetical protein